MQIMVVGAYGYIGREVVRQLQDKGVSVLALGRCLEKMSVITGMAFSPGQLTCKKADVLDMLSLERIRRSMLPLNGIVYCVGQCPEGGIAQAAVQRLSVDPCAILSELQMHVYGLHNVISIFNSKLVAGARVTVTGSGINQYPLDKLPLWMFVGPYATAKAAQETLCKWWDRQLEAERKVRVHWEPLPAVDTPFHIAEGFPLPPSMIPVQEAARRLLAPIFKE